MVPFSTCKNSQNLSSTQRCLLPPDMILSKVTGSGVSAGTTALRFLFTHRPIGGSDHSNSTSAKIQVMVHLSDLSGEAHRHLKNRRRFCFRVTGTPRLAHSVRSGQAPIQNIGVNRTPSSFRVRWKTNAPPKGGASFSVPGTRLRENRFGGRAGHKLNCDDMWKQKDLREGGLLFPVPGTGTLHNSHIFTGCSKWR